MVRSPFLSLPLVRAQWQLAQIRRWERRFEAWDDEQLRKASLGLRYRARQGESLERLVAEAFALVRVASERVYGMRPYDEQVLGGLIMHHGGIAEMQTGEGKTLTATLPLYVAALEDQGAHLATANDYLARRDGQWVEALFRFLGMSVGVVDATVPALQRRRAYACDITYGTAKEFGFDFLRDRLRRRNASLVRSPLALEHSGLLSSATNSWSGARQDPATALVQRDQVHPLPFVLVDEADSILIDEARTPLVISAAPGPRDHEVQDLYRWSAELVGTLESGVDFQHDPQQRTVQLTSQGRQRVRESPRPSSIRSIPMLDLYERVQMAVQVGLEYRADREYVVRGGEIVIVDENTGRLAEGRKWRDGLHQAIEAHEGLEVTVDAGQAARITLQDFFRQYRRLAGMTGTALPSHRELYTIYRLPTTPIPTHRPCLRTACEDRVFDTAEQKWGAIVDEVVQLHTGRNGGRIGGRPVLVGTRSIEASEQLSGRLRAEGIEHRVLNAHRHAAEAELVAQAGQIGQVTVATNMAGRGTDIELGEGVGERGGLHVIVSELHESARIDRQLIGRCARQGDPGSYRRYMSLEDELLIAAFGERRVAGWRKRATRMSRHRKRKLFHLAQRKLERRHFRQRRQLLYFERQRTALQREMGQDPYLEAAG